MYAYPTSLITDWFAFFRKPATGDGPVVDIERDKIDSRLPGIRCPLCKWQPKASSRWMCTSSIYPEGFDSGCGTRWNTFDTRGLCPGCSHQWMWTQCLRCKRPSLHEDWYETIANK